MPSNKGDGRTCCNEFQPTWGIRMDSSLRSSGNTSASSQPKPSFMPNSGLLFVKSWKPKQMPMIGFFLSKTRVFKTSTKLSCRRRCIPSPKAPTPGRISLSALSRILGSAVTMALKPTRSTAASMDRILPRP